jgi:hypothetical protein
MVDGIGSPRVPGTCMGWDRRLRRLDPAPEGVAMARSNGWDRRAWLKEWMGSEEPTTVARRRRDGREWWMGSEGARHSADHDARSRARSVHDGKKWWMGI